MEQAKKAVQQTAALKLKLPSRTSEKSAPREMRMAKLNVPLRGLVLDYVLLSSTANFTFKGDTTFYVSSTVVLTGTTTIESGAIVKFLNNATTGISFNGPLVCQTSAYRPAVFTSKDDNSVGETISGSNNNPVKSIGNMYLVNGGASPNLSYRYLRISYAGTGIQDPFMLDAWHCQFLNCTMGINRPSGNILLRNVLFAQCTTCVKTANAIDGQHLTVDACNRFADATVTSGTILNSIFTAVTTLGNVTLDASSWQNASSSGVYKSIGAGNYYLVDGSEHRDQGTPSIDATLAKDLKTRTTYAPDLLPNNFTVDTVLSPTTVLRDTDIPDRGYHYDPLDYCLTARTLANATLQLTGGVAVGVYGSTGIILQQGGNLVSHGTPTALNRLVRYNTVQEQKFVWGANTDPTSLMSVATTPASGLPTITMRFTEISLLANTPTKRCILSTGGTNLVKTFTLQDCQVHGGYLYNWVYNNNPNQMTVTLLNNLLDRTDFTFNQGYQGDTTPFLVTMQNNLVLNSKLNLWNSASASQQWQVHDNFFDTVTLGGSGSSKLVHTHNGYRATTQITGATSGNVTITTADYQTGPLGNYYYPTTFNGQNLARLIDVGSAAANVLGLCPFTVRTDQTPEGVSQVDIGFHYVALGGSGNPLDNNGNGIPDYDETPVADAQQPQPTCRDTAFTITLTGSGNICGPLTFIIVNPPAHGSLSAITFINDTSAAVTYTPATLFCGQDSFTFKVRNNGRDSAPATVTLIVGNEAFASTFTVETCKNTAMPFTLSGTDSCAVTPIFQIVSGPNSGLISGTSPNLTYTPNLGFCGTDSLQYKVDGNCNDSALATVTFIVGDQTPIANCQDVMTGINTPVTFALSGSDSCNDVLTFTLVNGSGPMSGMLNGNGSTRTYTPNTGFEGTDGFDFTVSNCGFTSPSAHVTVNVVPGPTLTTECRPNSIILSWTLPPFLRALAASGYIQDFQIFRCPTTSGSCTPSTSVFATINDPLITKDPLRWRFVDTSVTSGQTFCYAITFRHKDDCDGVTVFESPRSATVCATTCCPPAEGLFWTDYGPTPLQLAQWIVGNQATVVPNSAAFTGVAVARGTFGNGANANLPIGTGVILCSGDIILAKGPNSQSAAGKLNNAVGDSDLDNLVGFTTSDAAVLEFDITSTTNVITFQYVFASEEYLEFVGSEFDDPFAIFVDGANIALVPSTTDLISVNTINLGSNSQYYRNNPPPPDTPVFNIQYDGFTTLLTSVAQISLNVSHHVKIVIADSSDQQLDSAVFISAQVPCP